MFKKAAYEKTVAKKQQRYSRKSDMSKNNQFLVISTLYWMIGFVPQRIPPDRAWISCCIIDNLLSSTCSKTFVFSGKTLTVALGIFFDREQN